LVRVTHTIFTGQPYQDYISVEYLTKYILSFRVLKKYFIVEKDDRAMERIKTIVNSFDGMLFSGCSKNQDEALTLIFKNSPDIIFLNIDNTLNNLPEFLLDINKYSKNPHVYIALSSSEKHAYKAFKYDFFDYLLKPLTELAVRRSILKYIKKHPTKTCETICLKSNKDYQYLNTNDILFLKADNNTTDFHMRDGSVIGAYKTLKTFENKLPENFLRIHKSYIINSCCISRIHYGKSICIITNPSYTIPFTKTFIGNIDSINATLSNRAFVTLN
jgi:DNA-binding LytR/AlgR family response regulator